MLSLFARFGPMLLPVIIGAIPAFAGGWFAHGVKFDWFDRPAIIREATATADAMCALRVSNAAVAAEIAERKRQIAAGAEAERLWLAALAATERRAAEAGARLDQEISDYEAQLAAQGRSCLLTQPDIDWLYGRGPPGPAGSR